MASLKTIFGNFSKKVFFSFIVIILLLLSIHIVLSEYNVKLLGVDERGEVCVFKINDDTVTIKVGQTYNDGELIIHVFDAIPTRTTGKSWCDFTTNVKDFSANKIDGRTYEAVQDNGVRVESNDKNQENNIDDKNNYSEQNSENIYDNSNLDDSEIENIDEANDKIEKGNDETKDGSNKDDSNSKNRLGFFEWILSLFGFIN